MALNTTEDVAKRPIGDSSSDEHEPNSWYRKEHERSALEAGNMDVPEHLDSRPILHGRRLNRIDKKLVSKTLVTGKGDGDSDASVTIGKQLELEEGNAIKYRTCSWQKTAALLFSEYICLAIMSFPYSYSVLGLVPGIILTIVTAGFVLYTSLVVW